MSSIPPVTSQDAEHLGTLAMKFRRSRLTADREAIADEYAKTVARLVAGGAWMEMPPPEDQLPDDWMPNSFADYWS